MSQEQVLRNLLSRGLELIETYVNHYDIPEVHKFVKEAREAVAE